MGFVTLWFYVCLAAVIAAIVIVIHTANGTGSPYSNLSYFKITASVFAFSIFFFKISAASATEKLDDDDKYNIRFYQRILIAAGIAFFATGGFLLYK